MGFSGEKVCSSMLSYALAAQRRLKEGQTLPQVVSEVLRAIAAVGAVLFSAEIPAEAVRNMMEKAGRVAENRG